MPKVRAAGCAAILATLAANLCLAQGGVGRLQITLSKVAMQQGVDLTQQASANKIFFTAPNRAVDVTYSARWSSSNASVVTVNPNTGLITSIGVGEAMLTAVSGPFTGRTAVAVVPAGTLNTITIAPGTSSVAKGLPQQFTATGDFSGTPQDITQVATWSASDVSGTDVASIDATGLARTTAVGTSSVQASLNGVNSNSAMLTVTPAVLQSLIISPLTIFMAASTIQAPAQIQMAATGFWTDGSRDETQNVNWSSDNLPAATIGNVASNNKGLLNGVGNGGSHSANIAHIAATENSVNSNTVTVSVMPIGEAAHFLEQSSFGPTTASIAHLQGVGFDAYLAEQLAMPQSYSQYPAAPDIPTVQNQFFFNALTAQDQLRLRVAFALEQIWVVSTNKVTDPNGYVPWVNMMERDAFGNYRDLMTDATLSPAMGIYLDMVNNDKPANGADANENYARELMQLFTIGVNQLNPDGTLQLDSNNNPIPTYDQPTVQGFAHVFTGWTFPTQPGKTLQKHNPTYYGPLPYGSPMVALESNHDTGAKLLLNGVTLPAGQTSSQDLNDALDNIFNHTNAGPFVCAQLIQHLVKSNPSPQYVQRVAAVFADDGTGVRGDLQAVVKAILMDQEARAGDFATLPNLPDPHDGHLMEPALFMTSVLRALNSTDTGTSLAGRGVGMGQNILTPGSVFNYFPPSYAIPQDYFQPPQTLLGPEFGIETTATAQQRANFINSVIYGSLMQSVLPTLNSYLTLAQNDPSGLVDALNQQLMYGQMSQNMHDAIVTAVSVYPSTSPLSRVQSAVYLIASSSQYQVEH